MKEILDFFFGDYPSATNSYFLSSDYGIINVSVTSDMYEDFFISKRDISEATIRGRDKPYFFGIQRSPLSFNLSFCFKKGFNTNSINGYHKNLIELAKWIDTENYIPFGLVGDNKMYYVLVSDASQTIHNGTQKGYVNLTLRCNSPWAYSKFKTQTLNNLTGNGDLFEFVNNGQISFYPEIWIKKYTNGDFQITNESTTQIFKFTGLLANEQVYVHNEKHYIETNRPGIFRQKDFNGNYLKIVPGVNRLRFYGQSDVLFRYQEIYNTI